MVHWTRASVSLILLRCIHAGVPVWHHGTSLFMEHPSIQLARAISSEIV